ncbi:prepilin peptidase [Ramlibacter sp. AW1]|uniref:Prepilin peptidase n=1 Tax=Ramlibacter aurantiacus TaxID=2801330 RepID=A0A937D0M5_9BURK|nr:A24 family peptidase [Ramlibacter aurantiacus]MBL0419584.1 prepilin peptidase [Ramlibacter aurantiacus]
MNFDNAFLDAIGALVWNPATGVLMALLAVAAWIDWRTYRIPNWLTLGGMVWGLASSAAMGYSLVDGLLFGLAGLTLGLALFLPLWLLRVMGAGDVKLMAMVGAYVGAWGVFKAALIVGVVGGIAVIAFALVHRASGRLATNMKDIAASMVIPGMPLWRPELAGSSIGKLPYGVSIAVGSVAYLVLRQVGLA